ncbi:ISAs1 family transposase [Nocardia shimofusensis]|uniref:ISAs1 family transposase n=1 Tax=Nocardia shimofusensis TaxID=228596 RepID=UPI00247FC905|nr:ISAs1 family transposase [Nocardia shimofusensis]
MSLARTQHRLGDDHGSYTDRRKLLLCPHCHHRWLRPPTPPRGPLTADPAADAATSIVAFGSLEVLAAVPDPRHKRGVRHPLATVLAVAVTATIAGARSYAAITDWAHGAGTAMMSRLGHHDPAPSEPTIRRVLQQISADGLDELVGAWMWLSTSMIDGRRVIAFDGKTLRGARDTTGDLPHLLAALCQRTGVVVAQIAVGAKTNKICCLRRLLTVLDRADAVVTADAMHCQRETAESIRAGGGHFILTIKGNQARLRQRVKPCPGKTFPHWPPRPRPRTAAATPAP